MDGKSFAVGRKQIREFVIITLGTVIVAAAVFFFLVPSHLSVGSISGLAVIIASFLPLPVSVITMALNVLCLILGFLLIGREFGAKTVYTSLLLPVVIALLEGIFPDYRSVMEDPFLDMVCYCCLVSVGLAVLFVRNASSGGLDIIARILNKFFRIDLGTAMSAAGMTVALLSALAYDIKTVVLSVLGTCLGGIVLDYIILGINPKKKVCVITPKHEELRRYILDELHSGATMYKAIGAYGLEPHDEIVVIADRNEYAKLMTYLSRLDPDAFVTVYSVREILYKPKRRTQLREDR